MTGSLDLAAIWTHISASPVFALVLTLCAYLIALVLFRRSGSHPLANPVLISIVLIVLVLSLTHTPYATYFQGAQMIHFLLGPATVALAVPLFRQSAKLRRSLLPLLGGLVAGSLTAILSAVFVAHWLGLPWQTVASLAPKSVTTPIAMAISEKIGGLPSLTAVLVIATGITGAVLGPTILRLLRVREHEAGGFAIGVASHGIGTARAFQTSAEMGAFSGLGMGINAIFTAIVVPFLLPLLAAWLGG
ncbi:LrgB family protein [Robbsia sp. KACC 23696]|uniref:LrgB family protein n=1 Tax=Robbsia sp. KACC 23696 TaxID=3149231 RepID=UPI00325A7B55